MHSLRRIYGFTLVELMVVVAIIAILVSLMTPAVEEAMYQAQLAVCATRLNGIALGAATYANDNRSRYPHRNVIEQGYQPVELKNDWNAAMGWGPPAGDDRPRMRGHINLLSLIHI